jgi:hypothetical protein
MFYALPYMEQDPVYKNVYNPQPPTRYWYQWPENRPAATGSTTVPPPPSTNPTGRTSYGGDAKIKTLVCPSAADPDTMATVLLFSGQTNGVTWTVSSKFGTPAAGFTFSSAPGSVVLNRMTYAVQGGYPLFDAGDGVPDKYRGIFIYGQKTKIVGITDGASNTILAGEYADANVDFGTGNVLTGDCAATFMSSQIYTYWGIRNGVNPTACVNGVGQGDQRPCYNWFKWSSKHTGITQFVMGDGSVRAIKNNIDFTTFVVLGGMMDGVVVGASGN